MLFLKMLLGSFTIVYAATSSDCSNWFQVTEEDYPVTLSSSSITGTQTDVLTPTFEELDTQSELDAFLDTIPTRTNDALPDFDDDSESRVGIISAMKACEYNPVLDEVRETEDLVQVRIVNNIVSDSDCTVPDDESYRYFIIVFDDKDKPITVLTETEETS